MLSGFGLAGASGLSAFIPLFIVGLLGRTGTLHLTGPFEALTWTPTLILLGIFCVLEIVVDKIPGADHVSDAIMTFIRPIVGALLFASQTGTVKGMHPVLLITIALILAFGVHATKAVARPVVNATTFGAGAPVVSTVENIFSLSATLLAIFVPILLFLLVLLAVLLLVYWFRHRRSRLALQRTVAA